MQGRTVGSPRTITGKQGHFGAGKVALVNSTTSLGCNGGSTPCSPSALAQIIDLVGYGNANFFEGAGAAPTASAPAPAAPRRRRRLTPEGEVGVSEGVSVTA